MQNLPIGSNQADRDHYLEAVLPEGSRRYAWLYASGEAPADPELPISVANPSRGFPAEDFNNFATVIYLAKDNHDEFSANRAAGKVITHIDVGTGPMIDNIIAGLPEVDRSIAVDLTPANIQVLNDYKDPTKELPAFWNAWLDVAVILHDVGSPEKFLALDKDVTIEGLDFSAGQYLSPNDAGEVNLYDALRKWSTLNETNKALIRARVYEEAGASVNPENPYKAIQQEGLQNVLARKLVIRQGDHLNPLGDDKVPSVADLEGEGDLVTSKFVTESNDRKLSRVLHGDNTISCFSKSNGFRVVASMAGADGYGGFLTQQQVAEDPDLEHEECPMSRSLLEDVLSNLITSDRRYRLLTQEYADLPKNRQMVRPGKEYSQAVITAGRANHLNGDGLPKFKNGTELRKHVGHNIRRVGRVGYFSATEPVAQETFVVETADRDLKGIGAVQLGHSVFNWDSLGTNFWESYADRHYQQPQKADLEHLLSVISDIKSGAKNKDSTFISVRTASAPQYALAAMAGGMENIIVSHQGQPGVDWLEKNLLGKAGVDPDPVAVARIQIWWDIAKLMSAFNSQDEFARYTANSGFDVALNNWGRLPDGEKQIWFNRCLAEAERNNVEDSFLKRGADGQAIRDEFQSGVQQMKQAGKFRVEKFSPMAIPEDLRGTADVVECSYVTDSISQIPSERCDCVQQVCSLAKPGTGRVNLAETPYTNWDLYEPNQSLPSLARPLSYLSLTARVCTDGTLRHNQSDLYAREARNVRKDAFRSQGGTGRRSGEPLDTRFDYLEHVSFRPADLSSMSGLEMLGQLHQGILEETRHYLSDHPDSSSIDLALFQRDLGELEQKLGMEQRIAGGSLTKERLGVRIDNVKNYLLSRAGEDTFMNVVADEALNQFLQAAHNNLINRAPGMTMQTFSMQRAGAVGYVGAAAAR